MKISRLEDPGTLRPSVTTTTSFTNRTNLYHKNVYRVIPVDCNTGIRSAKIDSHSRCCHLLDNICTFKIELKGFLYDTKWRDERVVCLVVSDTPSHNNCRVTQHFLQRSERNIPETLGDKIYNSLNFDQQPCPLKSKRWGYYTHSVKISNYFIVIVCSCSSTGLLSTHFVSFHFKNGISSMKM